MQSILEFKKKKSTNLASVYRVTKVSWTQSSVISNWAVDVFYSIVVSCSAYPRNGLRPPVALLTMPSSSSSTSPSGRSSSAMSSRRLLPWVFCLSRSILSDCALSLLSSESTYSVSIRWPRFFLLSARLSIFLGGACGLTSPPAFCLWRSLNDNPRLLSVAAAGAGSLLSPLAWLNLEADAPP